MKAWLCLLFTLSMIIANNVFASGAFNPGISAPELQDEEYNLGKALVRGRAGSGESCKNCHKTFKRKALRSLDSLVTDLISNCEKHTPCYKDSLDEKSLQAINTYFSKRYNLR